MSKRLSLHQYRKEAREQLKRMRQNDKLLPEEERNKRVEMARQDYFYFFATYLPHYMMDEQGLVSDFAPLHRTEVKGILADIQRNTIRRRKKERAGLVRVVAAPRGSAKTTHLTFGITLYCIIFKLVKFIPIVSGVEDLADDLTAAIKEELKDNANIKADFGDLMQWENTDGKATDFSANGCRVKSIGVRQMLRGFKAKQYRPRLMILDDLMKDETAQSAKQTQKLLDIIKKGIYPGMAPYGTLLIHGTIIKKRDVMGRILLHDEAPYNKWYRQVYTALVTGKDGKEKSFWSSRWSTRDLQEIRKTMGEVAFQSEFMNNPAEEAGAVFKEDWFTYFILRSVDWTRMRRVMFADPSLEGKASQDYKAIITLGLDLSTYTGYFLNVWLRKASVNEFLNALYRIYGVWMPEKVGLETNSAFILLQRDINRMNKERGMILPVVHRTSKENKEQKIRRGSPFVERGIWRFRNDGEDDTEFMIQTQMLDYPDVDHDDGPDTCIMAWDLLDMGTGEPKFLGGKKRTVSRILKGFR